MKPLFNPQKDHCTKIFLFNESPVIILDVTENYHNAKIVTKKYTSFAPNQLLTGTTVDQMSQSSGFQGCVGFFWLCEFSFGFLFSPYLQNTCQ